MKRMIVIAGCISLFLGLVFWLSSQFFKPQPPVLPPLPNPNGYDKLVSAWSRISESEDDQISAFLIDDTVSLDEMRSFLQEHTAVLNDARTGLSRECRVPIEFSREYLYGQVQNSLGFRRLSNLFQLEGELAEREGRLLEALRSYLDLIRLGLKGSRGGLLIHRMVGVAIAKIGASKIQALRPKLDLPALKELVGEMREFPSWIEPTEDVFVREFDFMSSSSTYLERLAASLYSRFSFPETMKELLLFSHAELNLLVADLAVHLYRAENGKYPGVLEELVPRYLEEVPEDPFAADAHGKCIFRTQGDGYLLYSVGPDGKDAEGLRVSKQNLLGAKPGDLFVDTPFQ